MNGQDDLYQRAAADYGPALARLTNGYEADPEKRRDLLQEIHLALWRSFKGFNETCSLRTWVFRVAHNTAISWVIGQKRSRPHMLVSLEEADPPSVAADADRRVALDQITTLIHRLKPLDRQIILAWLEGMDADEIGELTGLSAGNAATKVHRIKQLLARSFHEAHGPRRAASEGPGTSSPPRGAAITSACSSKPREDAHERSESE